MTKKLMALNNAAIDAWAVVREWYVVTPVVLITLGVVFYAELATN